ncbi:MAG: hypothetical protein NTY17_01115 [Planctomycetia bacterium]|nr:hypothetical protein [Planctomycetia bacterium]
MERNDLQVAAVLRELADLGRRIGEQAGELARLTTERHAGSSQATSPPTPRKAPTSPRERTTRTPGRRPAEAKLASEAKQRHGDRSRPAVVPRRLPKSLRAHRRRSLVVGPGLVSGLVHLIALLGLAMMYVTVKAEPVRVAITLGETDPLAEADPAGEATPDEVTFVAFDDLQQPDNAMESLTVAEAIAAEPLADVGLPPSEELFADVPSTDGAGAMDVASFESGDMLAEVAGGGPGEGGQKRGGQWGGGQGNGGAADGAATTFFGRAGQGRSVCFICDNSNSYRDGSFHAILDELARAVDSLRPEQSFFVIFSSDAAYPLFHPSGADALQPATVENKQKLRAWLGTVEMCSGGQGIHDAVLGRAVVHAFGVQQSMIDRRTGIVDPDRLREQQGRNQNLITIATAHGGTFTAVTVPAAAAALERLRPIPRNRSRGAVWGVKL